MENDPKKLWYVKTPQGIFGPYTSQQLKQFGEEGNVHAGYQVRKGPDGEWVAADKIRGLKTRVPVAEPVKPAVPSAPHRSRVANRARASRTSPFAWLAIVGVPVGAALLVGTIIAVSSQSASSTSTPESSGNSGQPVATNERSWTRDRQGASSPVTVGGKNSPMSVREIVQANEQSVLLLRGAVGSGTGFIVGDQLLVTNSHVVAVAALNPATGEFKDLRAYSPAASANRRGPYRVSLLYEDPDWDLAVLRILDRVDFRPVAMARNYQFQRGEAVTIIGNPGLFNGVETLETAVSTGILSTTHPLQGREHYQLGAAVNGGNSGGPVFGEAGQVIGVVVSKSLSEDEISFCIPVREAIRATAEARSISARSQQLMWKEHESRVPKAIANLAVPSGSVVTVTNPPWAYVFIASTADDLIEASEYAYAGNTIGMQQLIASGRVMMVDSGTKVQVIDSNMFCAVKILNGLYAGRTGLVSIQCLK